MGGSIGCINCRELFDGLDGALFILDETGRILDANRSACTMFACGHSAALGGQLGDLSQEAALWIGRALKAPQSFEWQATRAGGETFWSEIALRATDIDGCRRVIASVRDISAHKQCEKALSESQFFLNKSQLVAHIGTYDLDLRAGRWECSDTLDEILGIDRGYPKNLDSWVRLVHPSDRAEMRDYFLQDVLGQGQPFNREYRILRYGDGAERWVYGTGEVEYSEGQPVRMVGTIQDITELIFLNQTRVESERRFAHLVQHSADIITVVDEEGIRIHVSGPLEEAIGYAPRELLGKHILTYVHPHDRERIEQMLKQALEHQGSVTRIEYRVRHKNGSWVCLEAVGTNLLHDPATCGLVLNVRDVTERKRAEQALLEKEERYRVVSELSGQLIHDYDLRSDSFEWAGRVEEITGYTLEEFNQLGFAGWQALIHPEDRAQDGFVTNWSFLSTDRQVLIPPEEGAQALLDLDEQVSYCAHYRLRKKSGEYMHVAHQGTFIYDDSGDAARMLGSIKDETSLIHSQEEQLRLQEQLQHAMKMEAVGRLAGGIAHDFNNLLTVISGNLELTKMELAEADPLMANLDEIDKATHNAVALTRQLLAFSRRQVFEPKVLNLNDLVCNLQRMLVRVIGEDVSLKTRLAEELEPVRVDPAQFEQVLVNLAVNARDAMPEGGRLLIETENIDLDESYCSNHSNLPPGPYVGLAVSDNGQGMSCEVKDRIFEPFYTTKPVGKGTGLGLSMIFGVVKQSGGSIEVYSELGLGTTFKIYLPRVAEPIEKLRAEKSTHELPRGNNETILLVEDETTVREVAQALLRRLGYRVLPACNAGEALLLAEKHGNAIDLMMTDVVMPGINGRQLAERLHHPYPGLKVLFASGYAEGLFDTPETPLEAFHFIGKPYTLLGLAQKVREVLAGGC